MTVNLQFENELENSFTIFSKLADDLSKSYSELQQQVIYLNEKLEHTSKEKLIEINEKQRLVKQQRELFSMLPTAVILLDGAGLCLIVLAWLWFQLNHE